MIPGEFLLADAPVEINAGRPTIELTVLNTGDRPIQVGSHYHFAETNAALQFDRSAAHGFRLDIPAGTATRFEPGDRHTVRLVAIGGARRVFGLDDQVDGPLDADRSTTGRATTGRSTTGRATTDNSATTNSETDRGATR